MKSPYGEGPDISLHAIVVETNLFLQRMRNLRWVLLQRQHCRNCTHFNQNNEKMKSTQFRLQPVETTQTTRSTNPRPR